MTETAPLKKFPHGIHLFISFLTVGIWLIGYSFMYFRRNKNIYL